VPLPAWLILFLLVLPFTSVAATEPVMIYGGLAQAANQPEPYPIRLARLALASQNVHYQWQPAGYPMVQQRVLKEMAAGRVHLYWSMTSTEREQLLLPVRIPLDKGLNGWRVLLTARSSHTELGPHWQHWRFIQGQDWPDVSILKAAGLEVMTTGHRQAMFAMLKQGRGDVLPLSVLEAWPEADKQQLNIDPNWVLHYPSAVYFFVSPSQPELARQLEAGLEQLLSSGQFNQLFQQEYADAIRQAKLEQRTIIRLPNPLLPESTPIERKELWYQPTTQPTTQAR